MFTQNVTTAINLVASSLRFDSGEILMSDREYGTMQWAWERAAQRQGLDVRFFPLPLRPESPDAILNAAEQAITPRTRVLFFSHVLSLNGMYLPARDLCALARERGILSVVDGAHAPGLFPLDIEEIGCDYYGANCHKWLLAPLGTGFLAWAPEREHTLEPAQVSWGYHFQPEHADEPDEFGSTPRIRHLEFEGTRDCCPWLVVPEAIDFQTRLGWQAVQDRQRELSARVRAALAGVEGLRQATPERPDQSGPMMAFWLPPGTRAEALRRGFWDRRIEVLVSEWPDGLVLRIASHFYTTETEIDTLIAALPEVLRSAC